MRKPLLILVLLSLTLLIACGDKTAKEEGERRLKVGYAINQMTHEFYQNIVSGAEMRAEELGIDLIIVDSGMDVNAQINICENLIEQQVDVLIITPIDTKALISIVKRAKDEGIYVLTESSPIESADSHIGIIDRDAGKQAGLWFAQYAKENNIEPRILMVNAPSFEVCRKRVGGFIDGLDESSIEYTLVQEVDGGGDKEKSLLVSTDAFTANKDINTVFGINDNAATGALAAYKAAGLDEDKLTVIGFGFEGSVGQNALLSKSAYKAALAMFPKFIGVLMIDASYEIAMGKGIPKHYKIPSTVITLENFYTYYTNIDNGYDINLDAVSKINQ